MTTEELKKLEAIATSDPWNTARVLKEYLKTVETVEEPKGNRTNAQNRALHLDCKLIAEKLNDAGLDMKNVLKPNVQIPWSTESVKEYLWKPIMKVLYQKESTRDLDKTKGEIEHIHEVIMRELAEKHGIEHHPFPNDEQRQKEDMGGYKSDDRKDLEYPEYTGQPTF